MIKNGTDHPEYRLKWLLFTAPLETIGLFGFAWSSMGPDYNHWIVPLIFSAFVGVANYAIYMATIDYMVAAYGPYAASATGGNGFARDFLAGIAALYATPRKSFIESCCPSTRMLTLTQCTPILAKHPKTSLTPRLSLLVLPYASRFPSMSSTGRALRSVPAPSSPRRLVLTESSTRVRGAHHTLRSRSMCKGSPICSANVFYHSLIAASGFHVISSLKSPKRDIDPHWIDSLSCL